MFFFFSSRRRHTRYWRDWSSDVCSSDLEPTTGLDPQARHVLWDRLFRLKRQGVTLVLTTHYMDEAEQLCDRLVVMDGGRIVAEGSPRALIDKHSTREVVELRFPGESQDGFAEKLGGLAERIEVLPDRILLYV